MPNILSPFKGLSRPLWLLTLVNFTNRCGAMIMCFLSLYITENLHYTLTEAGWAMAIYGIGAIAGQQIGGYLTDKIGANRVQFVSLSLTGIMIGILLYVRNFYTLCAVLFLLNLISEAFRPANSAAIILYSDADNRTRSFSLMRIAFNLAITFALTFGGWLITFGWHYIFWADIATCFAAAFLLLLIMREKPVAPKIPSTKKYAATAAPPISPFRDKLYRHFIVATFLNGLAFMQIVWTIPQFFKQVYTWDEFTIGIVAALNGTIVMLTEMPIVHRIEQNKISTIRIIQMGVIFYTIAHILLILPTDYKWVAVIGYMIFISFGETFVMPFSTTWASLRTPEGREGAYLSAYGLSYAIANIIAPVIGTQLLYHGGYQVLWLTIAAISFSSWCYLRYIETQIHLEKNTV